MTVCFECTPGSGMIHSEEVYFPGLFLHQYVSFTARHAANVLAATFPLFLSFLSPPCLPHPRTNSYFGVPVNQGGFIPEIADQNRWDLV